MIPSAVQGGLKKAPIIQMYAPGDAFRMLLHPKAIVAHFPDDTKRLIETW